MHSIREITLVEMTSRTIFFMAQSQKSEIMRTDEPHITNPKVPSYTTATVHGIPVVNLRKKINLKSNNNVASGDHI